MNALTVPVVCADCGVIGHRSSEASAENALRCHAIVSHSGAVPVVEYVDPTLLLGRDVDGQPTASRAPRAGDVLAPVAMPDDEPDPRRFTVDYVVDERHFEDTVRTVCGVSWPVEPSEIHPTGLAGTTITVRSPKAVQ